MAKKTKTQPKARKTITSNNLADLSKLVKELAQDDENPENQQKPSALDKKSSTMSSRIQRTRWCRRWRTLLASTKKTLAKKMQGHFC